MPATATLPVFIRWYLDSDAAAVEEIDRLCYPEQALGRAGVDAMRCALELIPMVAEESYLPGSRLLGFMTYILGPGTNRLTRLAVHPDFRRQGVGRSLLRRAVANLKNSGRKRLEVEVCDLDDTAHLFLRACGPDVVRLVKYEGERDCYRFVWKRRG